MDINEFNALPVVGDISLAEGFEIGTKFLYGRKMSDQKGNKRVGQEASYLEVINISRLGNIEYTTRFMRLSGTQKEN